MRLSKEEKEGIEAKRKANIVPYHKGFYSSEHASPRDEHYLGSPENRQMEQFLRAQKTEKCGPKLVKKKI